LSESLTPISDLELDTGDEITIHKELIRIVERDIDRIEAHDTKNGWTSWAVIVGLVYSLILMFGELRKLQTIPDFNVITIFAFGFFFIHTILQLLNIANFGSLIKPKRFFLTNETYSPQRLSAIFHIILDILLIVGILFVDVPIYLKVTSIFTLVLYLFSVFSLLLSSVLSVPIGKKQLSYSENKFTKIYLPILIFFSIISSIGMFSQLTFPFGDKNVSEYILGGSLLAIVALTNYLLNINSTPKSLTELQDLRNDIIFLRVDIDTALKRYEIISEGKQFLHGIETELNNVFALMGSIEQSQNNMKILAQSITDEVSKKKKSAKLSGEKLEKVNELKFSYIRYRDSLPQLFESLSPQLTSLAKKQQSIALATDDWEINEKVSQVVSQKLEEFANNEKELNETAVKLDDILSSLSENKENN
jgi:hypothetical protein